MIQLILFTLSTFGYVAGSIRFLKLNKYFSWILVMISQSLFLYLAALANLLLPTLWATYLLGFFLLILISIDYWKNSRGKGNFLRLFFSWVRQGIAFPEIIVLVAILGWFLVMKGMPLIHFDNYSHWGLVVKYLFTELHLPTDIDQLIYYRSYPPATSLYISYFIYFCGYSQAKMIMGFFLFNMACLYSFFGILTKPAERLNAALIALLWGIFFFLDNSVKMNNLLVDNLLAYLTLAAGIYAFRYRKQLGYLITGTLLFTSMINLTKDSGLFFSLLIVLYVTYLIIKNQNLIRKDKLKAFAILIPGAFLSKLSWSLYVKFNYDLSGFKHSSHFNQESLELVKQIGKSYLIKLLDPLIPATSGIILAFTLLLILSLSCLLTKKHLLTMKKLCLAMGLTYIIYFLGVFFMYVSSMPKDEALRLAQFDRYAMTIAYVLLGTVFLVGVYYFDKDFQRGASDSHFINIVTLFLMVIYLAGLGSDWLIAEHETIAFKDRSIPYQYEKLGLEQMSLNDSRILVFTSGGWKTDFAGRYYLYTPNTKIYNGDPAMLKDYDQVLVLDELPQTKKWEKELTKKEWPVGLYTVDRFLNGN
ncbi:hypothetical protein ACX4ZB_03400 [Aerococcus urinae]